MEYLAVVAIIANAVLFVKFGGGKIGKKHHRSYWGIKW